eukprot:SAG31_NODE_5969_length_2233_cov_17.813964_1_plen_274_part_00
MGRDVAPHKGARVGCSSKGESSCCDLGEVGKCAREKLTQHISRVLRSYGRPLASAHPFVLLVHGRRTAWSMPSSHRPSGPRTSARRGCRGTAAVVTLRSAIARGDGVLATTSRRAVSVAGERRRMASAAGAAGGSLQHAVALCPSHVARAAKRKAKAFKNGMLPIHIVAWENTSANVVRVLLEVGGVEQLQATTEHGSLPMHYAVGKNTSVDVVQVLLEVGGAEQLQARNKNGMLPMHYAAQQNTSADVVRVLLVVGGVDVCMYYCISIPNVY